MAVRKAGNLRGENPGRVTEVINLIIYINPAQILSRQTPGDPAEKQQIEVERTEWSVHLVPTAGKMELGI